MQQTQTLLQELRGARDLIKKTDLIRAVVEKHPESAAVLLSAGMGCIGCAMARMETIEQGAKAHGFSDEDVDELVKKLNETCNPDKPIKKK